MLKSPEPSRSEQTTEDWLRAPLPEIRPSDTLHQRIMNEVHQLEPLAPVAGAAAGSSAWSRPLAAAAVAVLAAGLWMATRPAAPAEPIASLPSLDAVAGVESLAVAAGHPYEAEMARLRADVNGLARSIGSHLTPPTL